MRVAVRRLGNSSGVIIPKSMLAELGISAGDAVDLSLEDGRIAISPVKRTPREGWAEGLASEEPDDDSREWLEFGNIGDADIKW